MTEAAEALRNDIDLQTPPNNQVASSVRPSEGEAGDVHVMPALLAEIAGDSSAAVVGDVEGTTASNSSVVVDAVCSDVAVARELSVVVEDRAVVTDEVVAVAVGSDSVVLDEPEVAIVSEEEVVADAAQLVPSVVEESPVSRCETPAELIVADPAAAEESSPLEQDPYVDTIGCDVAASGDNLVLLAEQGKTATEEDTAVDAVVFDTVVVDAFTGMMEEDTALATEAEVAADPVENGPSLETDSSLAGEAVVDHVVCVAAAVGDRHGVAEERELVKEGPVALIAGSELILLDRPLATLSEEGLTPALACELAAPVLEFVAAGDSTVHLGNASAMAIGHLANQAAARTAADEADQVVDEKASGVVAIDAFMDGTQETSTDACTGNARSVGEAGNSGLFSRQSSLTTLTSTWTQLTPAPKMSSAPANREVDSTVCSSTGSRTRSPRAYLKDGGSSSGPRSSRTPQSARTPREFILRVSCQRHLEFDDLSSPSLTNNHLVGARASSCPPTPNMEGDVHWATPATPSYSSASTWSAPRRSQMLDSDCTRLRHLILHRYGNFAICWRQLLDPLGSGVAAFSAFIHCIRHMGFKGDLRQAWQELDPTCAGRIKLMDLDWQTADLLGRFHFLLVDRFGGVDEVAWGSDSCRRLTKDEFCLWVRRAKVLKQEEAAAVFQFLCPSLDRSSPAVGLHDLAWLEAISWSLPVTCSPSRVEPGFAGVSVSIGAASEACEAESGSISESGDDGGNSDGELPQPLVWKRLHDHAVVRHTRSNAFQCLLSPREGIRPPPEETPLSFERLHTDHIEKDRRRRACEEEYYASVMCPVKPIKRAKGESCKIWDRLRRPRQRRLSRASRPQPLAQVPPSPAARKAAKKGEELSVGSAVERLALDSKRRIEAKKNATAEREAQALKELEDQRKEERAKSKKANPQRLVVLHEDSRNRAERMEDRAKVIIAAEKASLSEAAQAALPTSAMKNGQVAETQKAQGRSVLRLHLDSARRQARLASVQKKKEERDDIVAEETRRRALERLRELRLLQERRLLQEKRSHDAIKDFGREIASADESDCREISGLSLARRRQLRAQRSYIMETLVNGTPHFGPTSRRSLPCSSPPRSSEPGSSSGIKDDFDVHFKFVDQDSVSSGKFSPRRATVTGSPPCFSGASPCSPALSSRSSGQCFFSSPSLQVLSPRQRAEGEAMSLSVLIANLNAGRLAKDEPARFACQRVLQRCFARAARGQTKPRDIGVALVDSGFEDIARFEIEIACHKATDCSPLLQSVLSSPSLPLDVTTALNGIDILNPSRIGTLACEVTAFGGHRALDLVAQRSHSQAVVDEAAPAQLQWSRADGQHCGSPVACQATPSASLSFPASSVPVQLAPSAIGGLSVRREARLQQKQQENVNQPRSGDGMRDGLAVQGPSLQQLLSRPVDEIIKGVKSPRPILPPDLGQEHSELVKKYLLERSWRPDKKSSCLQSTRPQKTQPSEHDASATRPFRPALRVHQVLAR